LLFLFVLIMSSCSSQKSTIYSQIPKPIRKAIERNYEYSNFFFFNVFPSDNTFLCWYYNQSTVSWFSYINGKLVDSGNFESDNKAKGLTIAKTNRVLKKELDDFHKTCDFVLDGANFGYVLGAYSSLDNIVSGEVVVMTSVWTRCLSEFEDANFIANDFKKILDLNYKTEITK